MRVACRLTQTHTKIKKSIEEIKRDMSHYKISHYGEGSIPTVQDHKQTVFSVCKEAPTNCPPSSSKDEKVYADDNSLLTIVRIFL